MSKPPPLQPDHICRVSVLEPEKRWSLRDDTLWMESGGRPPVAIPLASLRNVRLMFAPTRFQRNRFQCHLYNANGCCAEIQNEHYKGVMDFEDRSGSYRGLVEALVKRTAAVNPSCRFSTGTSWTSWILQTGFLAFMFIVLAFVLYAMGSAASSLVVVKLLLIAFYVPTAAAWIIKNKPRVFSPDQAPAKLLPEV